VQNAQCGARTILASRAIFDLNQSLSSLPLYRRHSDDLVNSVRPAAFFVLLKLITDARAVVCANGVPMAARTEQAAQLRTARPDYKLRLL
jgi:hypothetical protein